MSAMRVGLILSGGGAKGAYQAGVVKALAEMGTQVDAIAGASIGALNGAILASTPSLAEGAARLEELWCTLAAQPPLQYNLPAYLSLAMAGGMKLSLGKLDQHIAAASQLMGAPIPAEFIRGMADGLFSSEPLRVLIDRYLDPQALQKGAPLYIAAFESQGGLRDLLSTVMAETGLRDTRPSAFFHVQSLPAHEQRDALLASAAIPVLFAARQIGGKTYTDGGLGGWIESQGNTPITPLLEAGIRNVIVTHLSDGSLWSRHRFPDANIIEIRPQTPLERDGGYSDLLGFDQKKIPSWIAQGYADTKACIQRISDATAARSALKASEQARDMHDAALPALDLELGDALARLRAHKHG